MKILRLPIIVVMLSSITVACSKNPKEIQQSIGELVLSLNENDKLIEQAGIDSRVLYVVTPKNDTFNIEYGKQGVIYTLYEKQAHVFPLEEKDKLEKQAGKIFNESEALFSEYPDIDASQNIFDKNYYRYDTINEIVGKIVQPKKIGVGMTGLYFPKLKSGYSFSIYANNLDSAANINAMKMFQSIHYK